MFKKINVPKTENYFILKNEVLSDRITWFYHPSTTVDGKDFPFFSHIVVRSPGNPNIYPTVGSTYSSLCNMVLTEIFNQNEIEVNCILRINFNMTLPVISDKKTSYPHYDHKFDHKNLLIYFSDSDGDTVVCEEKEYRNTPKEDSAIIFEGKHYHHLPTYGRRVVLICTFI